MSWLMLQLELKLGTEKNGKRLLIESTNDMKNFAKSCFVKAMEGRKVKATKEQAAEWFETMHPPGPGAREMYRMAAKVLRTVSRDQVEKVWRGEWMALDECSNEGVYCKRCKKKVYRIEYANEKMRSPFCPACGAAQTDEAVEITMRRLEALNEED